MNKKLYLAVGLLAVLVVLSGCIEENKPSAVLEHCQKDINQLLNENALLEEEINTQSFTINILSTKVDALNDKREENSIMFDTLFYEYFDCLMAYNCPFRSTGGCEDLSDEDYRLHAMSCELGRYYIELYEYGEIEREALGIDLND